MNGWLKLPARLSLISLMLFCVSTAQAQVDPTLSKYVAAADPAYRWEELQRMEVPGGELVELRLISQTWKNVTWKHQLFLFKPTVMEHPDQAVFVIGGGSWSAAMEAGPTKIKAQAKSVALMASALKAPVVVLSQVPFQPIFENLREDDAIAFTFRKYLDGGDADWPLLLPMVKSVARAMDAAQAFSQKEWGFAINRFLVTGGSKRGWTTYLTAAIDSRVGAIVPVVFDILNMEQQMQRQQRSIGGPSEMLRPYVENHTLEDLGTERGKVLQRIVDPYAYRAQIKQPKLLVLGANDPYWATGALNEYWNDLAGEKHVLYMPNTQHTADVLQLTGGLMAMLDQMRGGTAMPTPTWDAQTQGRTLQLAVRPGEKVSTVRAWKASGPTADLRRAVWTSEDMPLNGDAYTFRWDVPPGESGVVFAEITYARAMPLTLSTTMSQIDP